MLNMLFKPPVVATKEVAPPLQDNPKNYPPDVLAIHRAFENAGVQLIMEHEAQLAELPTYDKGKVSRLEKLGFKQANQVREAESIEDSARKSKEEIQLVQNYKQKYPFYKFITERQVEEICNKWNLVCGDVDKFRGFVPEENLRQIENFKISDDDKVEKLKGWLEMAARDYHMFALARPSYGRSMHQNQQSRREIPKPKPEYQGFKICAPIKDMDTSGMQITDGYKLQHVPDPVVLQPVKGGYLIVTAWGDEASDPNVVNENFN